MGPAWPRLTAMSAAQPTWPDRAEQNDQTPMSIDIAPQQTPRAWVSADYSPSRRGAPLHPWIGAMQACVVSEEIEGSPALPTASLARPGRAGLADRLRGPL
eukprot:gene20985-biopygen22153